MSRRTVPVRIVLGLVIVAFVASTSACSAPSRPSLGAAASSEASTAEDAVRLFYTAHAEGREPDAFAMLSTLHRSAETTAAYVEQTKWRRDLRLGSVGKATAIDMHGRPDFYQRLFDVKTVTVEFYQAHDASARERGDQIEFVTVGRETPRGPWRIVEIGTAP